MGAKIFSHTHRSTMCGLKKLSSGVFPESWKVLAERRQQRGGDGGGNGPKTISPPVTWGDLIINLKIVYSTVYSGADQRKHQSSAPLAFVRGIHRWPVKSPHKGPVTQKMFPFDDAIMNAIGNAKVIPKLMMSKTYHVIPHNMVRIHRANTT